MTPRFRGFFLFWVLFSFTPRIYAEEISSALAVVKGHHVNCRARPLLSSEVIFQFEEGDKIQLLSKKGAWYAVKLPKEASVFVSKDLLRMVDGVIQVQGNRVHARSGPGRAYPVLGELKDGEVIRTRRWVGDWAEIEPTELCSGWVHASFVALLNEEDQEIFHDHDR